MSYFSHAKPKTMQNRNFRSVHSNISSIGGNKLQQQNNKAKHSLSPPPQNSNPTTNRQPIIDDDLIFSTPRSELNNPMSDQVLLDESASKANKDDAKDGDATVTETGERTTEKIAITSPILKRAQPKDLPSYPSRGVQNLEASAGKAALLAASHSKSPEVWKPAHLPVAGAAASLANNIRSPEPWNPGPLPTAAAAALLAGDSKPPEVWRPSTPSKSASQAAISVRQRAHTMPESKRPVQPPQSTPNALAAAGVANSPRKLSKPAPKSPPALAYDINKVNALAAQNAQNRLSAASQPRSALPQAQTDKNMSDILRAASISMAKNMKKSPPLSGGGNLSRQSMPSGTSMPPGSYYSHIPTSPKKVTPADQKLNRKSSTQAASIAASSDLHSVISGDSDERQIRYYPHLEEAARKAASERLARLQAEHDRARKASGLPPSWQSGGKAPTTRARSSTAPSSAAPKATTASKAAAATTTGATPRRQPDATDYARSMKIKSDTAKLTKQIASVDKDRQARDYLAILAVAERNVKSQMQDLETKVAEDQGRVPKHLQAEWDAKAKMLSAEYERKRAEESEKKKGKINMGGGLWYDQEDLERIARGNVQPILDEINVKAEKERARIEALRVEKETADRERKAEQERAAGVKAETKKAKVLEKAAAKSRRDAEKAEERERKAELKKAQREEKERVKSGKQTLKAAAVPLPAETRNIEETAGVGADPASDMEELEPRPMSQAGHERVDREREMHEAAKKEKGWFGSLQKRIAKRVPGTKKKDKSAVGGEVAMPNVAEVDEFDPADNQSISSISSPERPNSTRDVALAGTVSAVSSDDEAEPAGTVFVGGARLQAIDATPGVVAGPRYADSDSSSTSSGDLYTAEPRYKGLTSATYNPGLEDEGLGMPAFIPETSSRRYSTSSDSSLESTGVAEKTFGEEAGPSVTAPVTEEESRDTFGSTLSGKVKKSLEEFARGGTGTEVPHVSAEGPITHVEPPTPIEEELKAPIMPAATATEGSSRGSMDSTREKRSSRFSEIL
ncbi:hypothetical protein TWF225_009607 [Orbilia oligospora]|nr:hypothetical protein TWF751_010783 [Orbilia oligospora]KAF3174183.1 hypothetical protein TWF225_009607 [Orbilia oligospora]KAF3249855.1 hypothetical protein TWF217_008763 [Orbilia oligospora]KAF3259330.1 hypothetical protein TWF128_004397 [Orbilia oligospora]KAF3292495.1 hypothetical protein TWF132_005547 [Orbilia oligospora]